MPLTASATGSPAAAGFGFAVNEPICGAAGSRRNTCPAPQESPQVVGQILGRLVSPVRVLLQARENHGLQVKWDPGVDRAQRCGIGVPDSLENYRTVLAVKCGRQSEQLVQAGPKGKDIRPVV